MRENGYSAKVTYSAKELTKKQRLAYEIGSVDSISLDKACPIDIDVENLIIMEVHNPLVKPDPITGLVTYDYINVLVVSKDGQIYTTSSNYFMDTAKDIVEDMLGEEEEWKLHCFKRQSKNTSGSFLTASIV